MLQGKHVLVVERAFLVAMDLQRMLESAGAGPVIFARSIEEALSIRARWPRLDLAIIETAPDIDGAPALIERLRAVGVAIVVTTGGTGTRNVPPDLPVLSKPIAETELLAACAAAVAPKSGAAPL